MEISYEEVESLLLSIFTCSKVAYIEEKDTYVVFKHPDNRLKVTSQIVYDKAYKEALEEGLLPISELEKIIEARKFFTEEDKKRIEKLQGQIKAQEVLLGKTTKVKAKVDRIKNILDNLRKELTALQFKRTSKLIMSAETKAEDTKNNYLCQACTYKFEEDERLWPSLKDMQSEKDVSFKTAVLYTFLPFLNGLDTKTIRCLARHGLWRIRYVNSSKTGEALFGVPTSDYNIDQLNLVYWSNFYSNIYEMMPEDRPSDSIIEDDESLDAYMKEYYEERSREDASRRSKKGNRGKLSAFDKEEVIVTQSNELYQDIEYDKPREAQRIKDRTDIKKRTRRS